MLADDTAEQPPKYCPITDDTKVDEMKACVEGIVDQFFSGEGDLDVDALVEESNEWGNWFFEHGAQTWWECFYWGDCGDDDVAPVVPPPSTLMKRFRQRLLQSQEVEYCPTEEDTPVLEVRSCLVDLTEKFFRGEELNEDSLYEAYRRLSSWFGDHDPEWFSCLDNVFGFEPTHELDENLNCVETPQTICNNDPATYWDRTFESCLSAADGCEKYDGFSWTGSVCTKDCAS